MKVSRRPVNLIIDPSITNLNDTQQKQNCNAIFLDKSNNLKILYDKGGLNKLSTNQNSNISSISSINKSQLMDGFDKGKYFHFKDSYILTNQELGKGSTACVRICKHRSTGIEYAVKIIAKSRLLETTKDNSSNPTMTNENDQNALQQDRQTKRIRREIKTYELTRGHPNICQLIDFFDTPLRYYTVFEKMEGGSLLNQIERRQVFTEAEASLVTRDIANALEFLHQIGIAHRDLKPENVLCKYEDSIVPVKLSDFDLASDSDLNGNLCFPVHTPQLTTPVGSAEFMAPEVVKTFNGQLHHYDKRCDMWSLGVIIYIMLCGYPPFYGQHIVPSSPGRTVETKGRLTNVKDEERENELNFYDGTEEAPMIKYCDINTCAECRDSLFSRIQSCQFDFPYVDWGHISEPAKDLISHLLIEKSEERFTATDVMAHVWVRYPAPGTHLQTPDILKRTNSCGDIEAFAQNAIAVNRMIQQCYAIHKDILGNHPTPNSLNVSPTHHKDDNDATGHFDLPEIRYEFIDTNIPSTPAPSNTVLESGENEFVENVDLEVCEYDNDPTPMGSYCIRNNYKDIDSKMHYLDDNNKSNSNCGNGQFNDIICHDDTIQNNLKPVVDKDDCSKRSYQYANIANNKDCNFLSFEENNTRMNTVNINGSTTEKQNSNNVSCKEVNFSDTLPYKKNNNYSSDLKNGDHYLNSTEFEQSLVSRRASVEELDEQTLKLRLAHLQEIQARELASSFPERDLPLIANNLDQLNINGENCSKIIFDSGEKANLLIANKRKTGIGKKTRKDLGQHLVFNKNVESKTGQLGVPNNNIINNNFTRHHNLHHPIFVVPNLTSPHHYFSGINKHNPYPIYPLNNYYLPYANNCNNNNNNVGYNFPPYPLTAFAQTKSSSRNNNHNNNNPYDKNNFCDNELPPQLNNCNNFYNNTTINNCDKNNHTPLLFPFIDSSSLDGNLTNDFTHILL